MAVMLMGAVLGFGLFCMVACFFNGGSAQPSGDCSASFVTLQPCYGYIATGNTTKPGNDCCTPLRSVFQTDAACLCQIAPMAQQLSITVNQTRALEIATACNQTVPQDVIACLSSVAAAPSPAVTNSSIVPSPPPPTGSTNTTPPSSRDGNFAPALTVPLPLLLLSIFASFPLRLII